MNSMEERKIYYDNFKHEYTLTPDPLFEDVHRYASVYPGFEEDCYSEYYIGASLDRPYDDINMYFTYTNEDVANDEVGTKRGFCLKIFSTYYLASMILPPKEYTKTLIALLEENHIAVTTTNTNISLVEEDIQKEARDENSIKQGEKSMYSKDVEQAILDGRATLASIVREAGTVQDKMDDAFAGAYKDGYRKANEDLIKLDPETVADIKNDAWDCLKRIVLDSDDGGLTGEELEQLFGVGNYFNILLDESITGEKAIDTVKAYLDKKVKDKEGVFDIGDLVVNGEKLYVVYRKYLEGSEYRYSIYNKDNIDERYSNMSLKGFELKAKNIFG